MNDKGYNTHIRGVIFMTNSIMNLTERLIPISALSQGKAGQIIAEVLKKKVEYIILKNNQPTVVLVAVDDYKSKMEKLEMYESFLEGLENAQLLELAEKRKMSPTASFMDLIAEEGISLDEIKRLSESVEFE